LGSCVNPHGLALIPTPPKLVVPRVLVTATDTATATATAIAIATLQEKKNFILPFKDYASKTVMRDTRRILT